MANWCPRCRGIEGAHFTWCIQASLWERTYGGPLPTPDLVEMPDLPPVEQSVIGEVSSNLVAELRAELAASQQTVETLREQRDMLAAELDDFRVKLEEARAAASIKLPKGSDPGKLAELIERDGDAMQGLMLERDHALQKLADVERQRDLSKGELRTARQQLDTAIRERDKARKLVSDPAALREARRKEAEEIREIARAASGGPGRVIDRDAGERYDDPPQHNVVAQMVMAGEKTEPKVDPAAAAALAVEAVVESDGTLAEAQAAARAEGATLEVTIEPEEQAKADYATEATERESQRTLSEGEQRSKEAGDLAAAAELFVAEHVVQARGSKLKNPDLQAAFETFLPTAGFVRKWSSQQLASRQLGMAMTKAGFKKRQIFDPETKTAPQNYFDAALANVAVKASPRESEQEGNHRGLTQQVDHSAGVERMREAAREAKRPLHGEALGGQALPGREIKNLDLRKMVIKLVQEQGWRYEKPVGRGHPRVFSPDGQMKKLATTPSGQMAIVKARSDLRRMGAVL